MATINENSIRCSNRVNTCVEPPTPQLVVPHGAEVYCALNPGIGPGPAADMEAWVGWALSTGDSDANRTPETTSNLRRAARRLVTAGVAPTIRGAFRLLSRSCRWVEELLRGSERLRVKGVSGKPHHGLHTWWTAYGTRIRRRRLPGVAKAGRLLAASGRAAGALVRSVYDRPGMWILSGVILAGAGLGLYRYSKRRIGGTAGRWDTLPDGVVAREDEDGRPVGWNVFERGPVWPANFREESTMVYSPLLVKHLTSYALFRERTVDLLLMLRNRGIRWLRTCNASEHDIHRVLPGSVVKAFMMDQREYTALRGLTSGRHAAGAELAHRLNSQQPVMNTWRTLLRDWTSGLSSWSDLLTAAGYRVVGIPSHLPAS